MSDILGRKLKDGDLCIGMAIGRNSHGMHIGVYQGASIAYPSYNGTYLHKSCTSNTYLIENPTEQELAIKEQVLKLLKEEEEERKRKANLKTIPLNKLEVGGIYKTTQGDIYLYLGKRKVIFEDLWRKTREEKEGHCFVHKYFISMDIIKEIPEEDILNDILRIHTYDRTHNVDVLKGNKKLTEMIRKIDLTFPITKTENNSGSIYYSNEKYRLTVE